MKNIKMDSTKIGVVFGRLLFMLTFQFLLGGMLGELFPCPLLKARD